MKKYTSFEEQKVQRILEETFILTLASSAVLRLQNRVSQISLNLFSSKDIKMRLIFKTVSQFFEILIFSQDIWENVHYFRDIKMSLISPT